MNRVEREVRFSIRVPLPYDPGTVLRIPNRYNPFHQIVLIKEVHFHLEGAITYTFNGKRKVREAESLAYSRPEYTVVSQLESYHDHYPTCSFDEASLAVELTSSDLATRERAVLKSIALRCFRRISPVDGIPIRPGTILDFHEEDFLLPGVTVLPDYRDPLLGTSVADLEEVSIRWIDRLVEGDEEAIRLRDQISVYFD